VASGLSQSESAEPDDRRASALGLFGRRGELPSEEYFMQYKYPIIPNGNSEAEIHPLLSRASSVLQTWTKFTRRSGR
jgi:hypothetical protein